MKTFDSHLEDKLRSKRFRELFEEEKELLEISIQVLEARTNLDLSQQEAAKRANITQQQLSRIESGMNFNIKTLIKVCDAFDLALDLRPRHSLQPSPGSGGQQAEPVPR